MSRILAIDYGLKRVGLAVTDPEQIIASPLTTVPAHEIFKYLESYLSKEDVASIVIGMPRDLFNNDSHSTAAVRQFVKAMERKFNSYPIHLHDERYTSKLATDAMLRGGSSKSDRREKGNIDKLSATIILQSFMEAQQFKR